MASILGEADYGEYVVGGEYVVATGVRIRWWDGSATQAATLKGWWDGTALRPVTAKGWWDGATVQPLKTG